LEYFIATHGGRKGKSDTALKTAEAGYLTRRLVDAVQDIIIKEYDCGSTHSHKVTREESEKIGEEFERRIYGRILMKDVIDQKTGEVIIKKGTEIGRSELQKISKHKIDEVEVRSVMTCKTPYGVCVQCYGKDLGTNDTVELGTAVGIIAAQSIGEPGTQLTMRTFHMGGVAEGKDITQGLTRVEELFEARTPKSPAILAEIEGKVKISQKGNITNISITSQKPIITKYELGPYMKAVIKKGDKIKVRQIIAKSTKHKNVVKAEEEGKILSISENFIEVISDGPVEKIYTIPKGKTIIVKNGALVKKGDPLTSGHFNLRELMKLTDIYTLQKYIMQEVQSIYASQGQTINDKHIEIIARQMLSKSRILDSGDSEFLPGEIVDQINLEKVNAELEKKGKTPAYAERLLLGLTRIALYTASWLSAASFQETIRVLVEASTTKKIDYLEGLKENVIIGKLIPAGETYRKRHPELVKEMMKHLDKDKKTKKIEKEIIIQEPLGEL
jgi:DNA-directed RNA polymerase subunit beta'